MFTIFACYFLYFLILRASKSIWIPIIHLNLALSRFDIIWTQRYSPQTLRPRCHIQRFVKRNRTISFWIIIFQFWHHIRNFLFNLQFFHFLLKICVFVLISQNFWFLVFMFFSWFYLQFEVFYSYGFFKETAIVFAGSHGW